MTRARRASTRVVDGAVGRDGEVGLEFIAARPLVVDEPSIRLPLGVGDRILVEPGIAVAAGAPLAVRVRDATVAVVDRGRRGRVRPRRAPEDGDLRSGMWRSDPASGDGERLLELDGGWWVARGTATEELIAPVGGVVGSVRPGIGIEFVAAGLGVPGTTAAGGPARGRLEAIDPRDGDLRAGAIDVGRSGAILVVGGRVDAEALTRARAMGVRGIVVGGMSEKDLHDLAASERRQLAGVHRSPPFAVLVLDGPLRRPIAEPVRAILGAAGGRDAAIVADPPMLLLGAGAALVPRLDPLAVRVTHGPLAGRSGRWAGLAGIRRFRAGIHLEAGIVRFADGSRAAVPLADLERYA
ncbi:MAG: hypothetical protein ACYDAK_00260 [Candidatus Limnocylindrales bacterium]